MAVPARLWRLLLLAGFILVGATAAVMWSGSTHQANAVTVKIETWSLASDNFVMEWDTRNTSSGSTDDRTIKLPLTGLITNTEASDHYFRVEWGDGSSTLTSDPVYLATHTDLRHTYSTPGRYTVTINLGPFQTVDAASPTSLPEDDTYYMSGFAFGGSGDRLKLVEIKQWGNADLGNTGHYFRGAQNLQLTATDNLQHVPTNMYAAFADAKAFNGDIGGWNTSNVTDTRFMFAGATSFNRSLNSWNMSKVTQATAMFEGATAFNGSVGNWNTSKIAFMDFMFNGAASFNQPINGWNTSAVTTMQAMFQNASSFNQSLNSWNTGKVATMDHLFFGGSAFNGAIGSWNVARVTDMYGMFYEARAFNQPLGSWNTAAATSMEFMFYGATVFNQPIDAWNTARVRTMGSMFYDAATFNQPIGGWQTAAVTDMSWLFSGAHDFNQDIGDWNTARVTTMKAMFQVGTAFNGDIGAWNTAKVTDMSYMFLRAAAFNQDVSGWSTGNVTTMEVMFNGASSFDRGLAAWSIAKVTSMRHMLGGGAHPVSSANYDAMLIAWSQQAVRSNVVFTAGGATRYNSEAAKAARQSLIDSKAWTMQDGGQVPQPTVTTDAATDVTSTSARLRATVRRIANPTTGLTIKYSTNRATVEGGGGTIAAISPVANPDAIDGPISAPVTGLTANATYYYRVAVANPSWTAVGDVRQFLAAPPPSITINSPTAITGTSATVNASVNPNGFPTTALTVKYAASSATLDSGGGTTAAVSPGSLSGSTAVAVSAPFTGLTVGTTYYYRISATTAAGTTTANGQVNTGPPPGLSIVTAGNASGLTTTGATINGTVNTTGVPATGLQVRYSTSETTVTSGGGTSKALTPATMTSSVATPVSAALTGLSTGTTYYYQLSATNSFGTSTTPVTSFTTYGRPFISTWDTSKGDGQPKITLPLQSAGVGAYNFTVDWGDGSTSAITSDTNAAKTHTYATGGVKTVTIMGSFKGWDGSRFTDREKLTNITQWGTLKLGSVSNGFGFFQNAKNLQISATDAPDLSASTSLVNMFSGATAFNSPIGHWDTSTITNMGAMFQNARAFNQPIGSWNTGNVTSMPTMFSGATSFNQPIGSWNTGNVTSMFGMFNLTDAFDQPIGSWNTAKVSSMQQMFYLATAFNQPIGTWNTGNVVNMFEMFRGAKLFNQPIGTWNTSNVTNMNNMFSEAAAFNQPIGTWNTSNVTNMSYMFSGASAFNQPIGAWNTTKVTTMSYMFSGASAFNQPIGAWNTSNVTTMASMFFNASAFNQPIGAWNTTNVTTMYFMFSGASTFNQPIGSWNTSNVANMGTMFYNASAFDQSVGLWNVGKVTSMSNMLDGSGLSSASYDATLAGWAPQTVTSGVSVGASGRLYSSAGQVSRATLIGKGWSFSGDALLAPPVVVTGGSPVVVSSAAVQVSGSVNPTGRVTSSRGFWVATDVDGLTNGAGLFVPVSGTVSGSSPVAMSATVSGLAPRTQYFVQAAATTDRGSARGDAVSVTTAGLSVPSSPGLGVDSVPDRPHAVAGEGGDGVALVSWVPGQDGGSAVSAFTVTVSPVAAGAMSSGVLDVLGPQGAATVSAVRTCTAAPPATSCVVSGLTNGTAYTATATATNIRGPSATSDVSEVFVPAPVAPPVPVVSSVVSGDRSVTVTVAPGVGAGVATSYVVRVSPGAGTCTILVPATSCTVSGLTNGVPVTVAAQAVNATGGSLFSPESDPVTVGAAAQTVSFGPAPTGVRVGGAGVPVSVTSNAAGATVVLTSLTPDVCAVTGLSVSGVGTGVCQLRAESGAVGGYGPASAVGLTFTVAPGVQVVSFTATPASLAVGAAPVAVTASSNAPGADVQLDVADTNVCTLSGGQLTAVSPGMCVLTASSAAVSGYDPGTATVSIPITAQGQVLTFTPAPVGLRIGDTATVSASSDAPGASITVASGTPSICTISGTTVSAVAAGTCTITGSAPATGSYGPGSGGISFPIGVRVQTVTFGAAPSGLAAGDPPVDVSVSSNAPGATVTLTSVDEAVCTVSGVSVTPVAPGVCDLRANAPAVGDYGPAATANLSVAIGAGTQTLTFASAPTLRLGQDPVTVAVTSNAPGADISLTSDTPGVCDISEGQITAVTVGTCTVRASAPAVGGYGAAADATLTFPISPRVQTLVFGPTPAGTRIGDTPTVTATSNATGATVTYTSTTPGVCTISGTTVTALTAGDCHITAHADAIDDYDAAADIGLTFPITPRLQTLAFAQAPTGTRIGDTPTVTATSNAAGATVTYTSTTPSVCTISGATVTALTTGDCHITAHADAIGDYEAAADITTSIPISARLQTLSFAPAPTGTRIGDTPTVTATSNATGATVTYTSATQSVCTISGATITALTTGDCHITAHADAIGDYAAATDIGQQFPIAARLHSLTFGAAPAGLLAGGAPAPVTVTSNAPGATIVIESATPTVCTVTGTNVNGLRVGTCVLRATADPVGDYAAANETGQSFPIAGAAQTLTVATTPTGLRVDGSTVPVAVTSDAPGATVTITSTSPDVCTITGATVAPVAAGTCTLSATAPATDTYNAAAPLTVTAAVAKGTQTLTFTTTPPALTAGDPTTRIQATSSAPGTRITHTSLTPDVCTITGTDLTALTAGECTIRATGTATANHDTPDPITHTLTIAPPTPPLVAPPSPEAPAITDVKIGDQKATIHVTSGDGGAPDTITITAHPGNATCTITHPDTTCTITGLRNGTAYTFTAASTNDGGTSTNSPTSPDATPDRNAHLTMSLRGIPRETVTRRPLTLTLNLTDPAATGPRATTSTPANTDGTATITANNKPICTVAIHNGTGTCRHTPRTLGRVRYAASFHGRIHEHTGISTASAVGAATTKARHVTITSARIGSYHCTRYIKATGYTTPGKTVTLKIKRNGHTYRLGKARANKKGRWTVIALMHPGMTKTVWASISPKKRSISFRYTNRTPPAQCTRNVLPPDTSQTLPADTTTIFGPDDETDTQ